MPASKHSRFEAKIRREYLAARRSAAARDRANDLPRNPSLTGSHYSPYFGVPGSTVSADDLDVALKARERRAHARGLQPSGH